MKPSPFPRLRSFAMVLLALAFWVSTIHGFMHHHHEDFERHGDCAICKVIGASATLPDTPHAGELPSELVFRTPFALPGAFGVSARHLRLRAPATSPPRHLV
jgi:hypothetical protein